MRIYAYWYTETNPLPFGKNKDVILVMGDGMRAQFDREEVQVLLRLSGESMTERDYCIQRFLEENSLIGHRVYEGDWEVNDPVAGTGNRYKRS